jgi:hypothetical protein
MQGMARPAILGPLLLQFNTGELHWHDGGTWQLQSFVKFLEAPVPTVPKAKFQGMLSMK